MNNNVNQEFQVGEWRKRLRLLSDFIFATSMTIMIINIEIPEFGHITDTKELTLFLGDQLSNMWVFFIAFMVVAVYWIKHLEHYSTILVVNQTFIWLQLVYLGFIMLIPFWNTYITHFPDNVAIKVFLSINMVIVGLFSFLSLHYAGHDKNRLIHESVTPEYLKTAKRQIMSEPIIAVIAAGVAFINPALWDLAFIMVPILFMGRKRLVKISYFKFGKKK